MKSRKIFGIVSSSFLTLTGIYGVLPEKGCIRTYISEFINNHPVIEIITYICIIGFGILTIIAFIYDLIKENEKHELEYQSKEFFDFFSKWYSKKGVLTLICEDVAWTKSDENNSIYEALVKKAKKNHLNLIINKAKLVENTPEYKLAYELGGFGANIYEAPSALVSSYSFSSVSKMNNNSFIIVRKKTDDKNDKVIFRDINNIYVTELLNSLIDTLKAGGLLCF